MEPVTLLGLVAGTLTTIAFLPQVIKTWKSRSAADLSGVMLITFSFGLILWFIYGIFIHSLPVILANGITLILTLIILFFKFWFKQV